MKAELALLLVAVSVPAAAETRLQQVDRAGRTIAAAPCEHPRENKVSRVGNTADEMQAIDCRSHRVALYTDQIGGSRRQRPMALVVEGVEPGLPAGLAVGADPAEVQAQLRPPTHRLQSSLRYLLDPSRPAGDSISFEIDGGRVQAIAWNWRVD